MQGSRTTHIADPESRRSRRLLLAALALLAMSLLGAMYALRQAQAAQRETAGEARMALARAIAAQVDLALGSVHDSIREIAAQPTLPQLLADRDVGRAVAELAAMRSATRYFRAYAVLDAERHPLAVQPPSELALLQPAMTSLEPLMVQRGAGADATVLVRESVPDGSGGIAGAVVAVISLQRLLEPIERTRFGDTGAATVLDRSAHVVVSSDPARRVRRLRAAPVATIVQSGGEGLLDYESPLLQRREFSAVTPVPGRPLSVMVSQSAAEAFAAITVVQRGLFAALVVVMLLGGATFLRALALQRDYEQRIRSSNALFTAVTEGTDDVVFVKDRQGRYLLVNSAGARFVGRARTEVLGRSDFELFDSSTARRIRATDLAVVESGEIVSGEYPSRDASGSERSFSTVRAPYRDAHGEIVGVVGVARDVTAEREHERTIRRQADELARSNTLLAAVVEGTSDVVYVKDLDERYLLMNQAGARLLGVPAERIAGQRIDAFLPERVAEPIRARDREVIDSGATQTGEDAVSIHGVERTFLSVVAPWRDASGAIVGLVGISRDITEMKRARNAIAASEKRYRDLFEMSKGLICVHDLEGHLITVNPASASILGYAPEELAGRMLQEFVPAEHRDAFARYLAALDADDEQSGLLVLTSRAGEHRWLQFTNHVYREPGRAPYVIGHAQDITERRRYEQRLREISLTDPLTGLYNRRYLETREQGADAGARFGTIVVDLDHFKQINDTLGHQRGDEVLVAMGRFLQMHARRDDAVIRMGGDEFLVLLDDVDERSLSAMVERIVADGARAPCGFSIGHALRDGSEPLEQTIDRADLALYRVRVETRGYERRKH